MNSEPPLTGVRVLEFAGIGPGPHAAMLLSDLGAEVIRIEREEGNGWPNRIIDRGRANLILDIRSVAGRDRALAIADRADVLIEGFRPGVMERLGLGPDDVLPRNPRLVYGRITGWGQEGPLAGAAGHDLNYIALTGALAAIGNPGEPPPPPLNLVGDFGGGSMLLVMGILAALIERARSGQGQVVDAAIVDGVSSMMAMFLGLKTSEQLSMSRESNMLAGAAPFYRCYKCNDDRYVSIGAIEPKFYSKLLDLLDLPPGLAAEQMNTEKWPEMAERLSTIFASRTRDEWGSLLEGSDACFAPVLELGEVWQHPHMAERLFTVDDLPEQRPAPNFSRTPGRISPNRNLEETLSKWEVE